MVNWRRGLGPLAVAYLLGGAPAGADIVTATGTGTFGDWTEWDGVSAYRTIPEDQLPEWLRAAFPPRAPFSAAFTYDTSAVLVAHEAPDVFWYTGPITDWRVETDAHVLSPNETFEGGIVGVTNDSDFASDPWQDDTIYAGVERGRLSLDGLGEVAGNLLNSSQIYLYDPTRAALSSKTLPSSVCLGAFAEIRVRFKIDLGYTIIGTGTPDRSVDSDSDGLTDGHEIAGGTNPCSLDTDGDGLPDATDPDPLVPETPSQGIARRTRDASATVRSLPEAVFAGPNAQAEAGRRNALSNLLQAAANSIEDADIAGALNILEHVHDLLDGDPSPPDIMDDGPEKDALRAEVEALIAAAAAQI